MACGETKPLNSRIRHRVEYLCELRLAVEIASIRVNVLAQQRYFLDTCIDVTLCFGDDLLEWTGLLSSTNVGDDAIGAKIVATNGDRKPCSP